MVITIYEGYDKSYILLGAKDERFTRTWGSTLRIPTDNIYKELGEIASWVNNELGEACLFEID
jgi:hypothetical protein